MEIKQNTNNNPAAPIKLNDIENCQREKLNQNEEDENIKLQFIPEKEPISPTRVKSPKK